MVEREMGAPQCSREEDSSERSECSECSLDIEAASDEVFGPCPLFLDKWRAP